MMSVYQFSFVVALTLTTLSVGWAFLLRTIYWDWLKVPIGLQGAVFFLSAIPWAFVLSIPYAIVAWVLLRRRGLVSNAQRLLAAIGYGSLIAVVVVMFVFPCDVKPFFVGGYFVKWIFHMN